MDMGRTEDELFKVFGDTAGYLGGGCYRVNFLNEAIYATDTRDLWLEFKSRFTKVKGKYYYAKL